MASHFSDIGFEIASGDEVLALSQSLPVGTPVHSSPAGDYVQWSPGGGAELWFQRSPEMLLVGMNPHVDVHTRTPVRIVSRLQDPEHPMDGGVHLWLAPEPIGPDGDAEIGASPLFVDVPDFRRYDSLPLPIETDAVLAGFAHTLDVWESEEAFRATGSVFATESLIPSGLFFPGGDPKVPPRAEAIINGLVEAAEERRNGATGRPFWWARVRTFGARLEVVADPSLSVRRPQEGDVLGGTFWISARFPDLAR